jgi:hypothetical protein
MRKIEDRFQEGTAQPEDAGQRRLRKLARLNSPKSETCGLTKSFYGLSRTAATRQSVGTIEKATEPSHP